MILKLSNEHKNICRPSPVDVSIEVSKEEAINGNANETETGLSGNRRGSNDLYSPMGKSKRNPNDANALVCVMVNGNQELNTESLPHKAIDEDV